MSRERGGLGFARDHVVGDSLQGTTNFGGGGGVDRTMSGPHRVVVVGDLGIDGAVDDNT